MNRDKDRRNDAEPRRRFDGERRSHDRTGGERREDARRPYDHQKDERRPYDRQTGGRRDLHREARDDRGPERRAPRPAGTAREAALRALQDVVRGDAYAAQALNRQLDNSELKDDDRRLAASLFYFAVENRLYIERALRPFIESKPEPVIVDILHIAAAQLLFMDKIPDHAAVDEAVKQTRAVKREGYSGMVNGVLRNLIRARDAGKSPLPDREADPLDWFSVKYSIAKEAAEKLIEAYGMETAEAIMVWSPNRRELTVRPNRARMDGAAFEAWLDARELKWRRGLAEDAYIVENAGNLASSEGYRKGLFSIQGESAMLAALAVQPRRGMQLLDACAAPGGKTCLLAERMGGSGRVYAWDVHPHRVELIRAAAKRLGLDNVRPSEHDARKPLESFDLMMDAVLVDAPCSGLGVIAEKPDIKYRQSAESLAALPPLQRDILNSCARAVKIGGLLVYATCTLLPEENEAQVRAFLERHPEFAPDDDLSWLPEALRPYWSDGMIQILPSRDGLEGFFIARMRRKGD